MSDAPKVLHFLAPQVVGNALLKVLDSGIFTHTEKEALNLVCHFAQATLRHLPRELCAALIAEGARSMLQHEDAYADKLLAFDFKLPTEEK